MIRQDRSTQAFCPGHAIAAAALAFGLMALEGEGMPQWLNILIAGRRIVHHGNEEDATDQIGPSRIGRLS